MFDQHCKIVISSLLPLLLLLSGLSHAANYKIEQYSYIANSKQHVIGYFLPKTVSNDTPLLVFLTGDQWKQPNRQSTLAPPALATLLDAGIAVAAVRHRYYPAVKAGEMLADVATATGFALDKQLPGYKPKRIYLWGFGSGAHLAALLVTDRRHLKKVGHKPEELAGTLLVSGIYDLTDSLKFSADEMTTLKQIFGNELQTASPATYLKGKTPPVTLINAEKDLPGAAINARHFMEQLRQHGNSEAFHHVIKGQDRYSTLQLENKNNHVLDNILIMVGKPATDQTYAKEIKVEKVWHKPPLSTLDFWQHSSLIKEYDPTPRFAFAVTRLFKGREYKLTVWPYQHYYAIDLLDLIKTLGPDKVGHGEYLQVTNIRNEKVFWKLSDIKAYKPVVVVGIDDEKNLYKFTTFYQAKRQYSWQEAEPPSVMVRPLGAFIFFQEKPPAIYDPAFYAHYSLTTESFKLSKTDPLAGLQDLPPKLFNMIVYDNGCTSCHSLRGIGTQSHHNNAVTMKAEGGLALPLESYPPTVWKEFVFNQEKVANVIGVQPNLLPNALMEDLYKLVEQERNKKAH